ncbi:MAG: 2TM domain-containing protein [Tenacibaculum sp.]
MELDENLEQQKYIRAKKRVEVLKGFYIHLVVYIVVNTLVSTSKIVRNINNGETFSEAFFDINTLALWFLWGVPMVLHTFKAIGFNLFFGSEWEKRKINQYLNESNNDKY